MTNIPFVKEDKIMKKESSKGKDKYKNKRRSFDRSKVQGPRSKVQGPRSKVQMELICDGCNSHRCVYSNKMVGGMVGPTKTDV